MEQKKLNAYEQRDLGLMFRGRSGEIPQIRVELIAPAPPEPPAPGTGALREYLTLFRRHAYLVLAAGTCCGLISYLMTLPQRPTYRAETVLEVQSPNENFLNFRDFDPGSAAGPESYVEAQVKVLEGDDLLDRTAHKLGVWKKPDLWLAKSFAPTWKVRLGIATEARPAPTRDDMLARLKGGLVVHSGVQSRVVGLQFESSNPQFAADFANALANELIDQNLETRLQSAERTAQSLSGRLKDLRSQMEKSGNELQAYAGATGLILDQTGGTAADEKLRQIQSELSRAQAERAAKQAKYEVAAASKPESLPDFADNGSLRDTQGRLTELKRQHAELSSTFAPTYFKVKTLAAQVSELESLLKKEQSNLLDRIQNDYKSALGREKLLQHSYEEQAKIASGQAAAAVHYNTLKHEVETSRVLYDAMLQKVREAGIAAAVRASNIRILNRAKAPSSPFRPKPAQNAATGLLAGLFLAAAFVLVRDQTDGTIRDPGEIATHLSVNELGTIPSSGKGFEGLALTASRQKKLSSRLGLGLRKVPTDWVRSGSRLAESFRSTLASLWFASKNGESMRVFVVTSPNSGDGKSTIVSHLGATMAHTKRRVLLVDADLRRPVLHKMFGLDGQRGLADILEEQRPIDDYSFNELFQETEFPELYVLPGGTGSSNVTSLRFHDRLIDLLLRVRLEFEVVLIDTPPAIESADARILGLLADGVVLVFRASRTTRNAAWVTVRRFQDDGAPVVGTILNDWKPKNTRYGYDVYRPDDNSRQHIDVAAGARS
jgi:succinoglycan biosynthesis transport protein ExoP